MLEVTHNAREELKRTLETKSLPPGKFLKLAVPPEWVGPGEFGIVIEIEKGGEHVVEHEGVTVLMVDHGLAENLSKAVFDFKDSPQGPSFTLDIY